MAQQINLYKPELRPKPDYLTLNNMAKGAGVFLALMVLLSVNLGMDTQALAKQREAIVSSVQAEQTRLLEVTQQFPVAKPDPALDDQITFLEMEQQRREQVMAMIKGGDLAASGGFSGMMQAFARQMVQGVWLTGLAASASGESMRISGRALTADLIPQYISRLSAEPALQGRHFSGLQVVEPSAQAQPVAQTQPAASPADARAKPMSYVEFTLSADKSSVASPVSATDSAGGQP